ncbi:AAA family ATPase [Bibersteinia trehalosi]|uniref:AAA family ATPase n=1 Tax=Bibersteinia trehalosi TaxID=47735 RepID=UPI004045EA97
MIISNIEIQNFRKLKKCSINLSHKETLFVGANNSGKTSAMNALMFFLGNESRKFKITDFPMEYWENINQIGESWLDDDISNHIENVLSEWQKYCPRLYITISNISNLDLPKIKHLIPNLSWDITSGLHTCLIYEPKNLEKLKADFIKNITQLRTLNIETNLSLPNTMKDFLEKNINTYFSIVPYLVDKEDNNNLSLLDSFPFDGIFKLSLIPAQRKFADSMDIDNKSNTLSDELSKFYNSHLDFRTLPSQEDIDALLAIEKLQTTLTEQLGLKFKGYLDSLATLGYPSTTYDPEIKLESFIESSDILKRNTIVKFGNNAGLSLPEELNGLGYRNLIYIFFKLLSFKAEWQREGKAAELNNDIPIEPIHLVLIEEPEAHLHSQVQQVFVKKAYEVLTMGLDNFTTQLIISTHSSYIINEIGFEKLHYFKRLKNDKSQYSESIDLSKVFGGDEEQNKKFVSRYLKVVHCDLFFSNAIILVEGAAERILLPHFIHHKFSKLDSSYISILEVNGAHAHRFKPLIEALGVPCLVLSDLDTVDRESNKKVRPIRNSEQKSNCNNLTKWLNFDDTSLDVILKNCKNKKIINNTFISYQMPIPIKWNGLDEEVIPYTFEDSIVFSNLQIFQDPSKLKDSTGMIKRMHEATLKEELNDCCQTVFESLSKGTKAQMALDILYEFDEKEFYVPNYIEEGLNWLIDKLNGKETV